MRKQLRLVREQLEPRLLEIPLLVRGAACAAFTTTSLATAATVI